MKRLVMLVVLAALPLAAASVSMTATFTAQDLSLSKVDGYDVVELNGGLPMVSAGEPRLPHLVQSLAIPADATPTRVVVEAEEWIDLPGVFRVGPAQPDARLPRAGERFSPTIYPPDPLVYGAAGPYPAVTAKLLTPGTLSGYRIAHVDLNPVRFTPATGRLELATRIRYRVDYTTGFAARPLATERQREAFGNLVRKLVVNAASVASYAPRVNRARSSFTLPPGDYDYVVITETPMDTVFARLCAWKTARGVPATVVLLSYITTNYSGYDVQEKIRNFIIDAHATWGTMYVLLGAQGDRASSGQNIIPTRYGNCDNEDQPCDFYYGCLDGTWDANGNHRYGEISDNPDIYPDVHVGRAPVYNVAMAQNFVRKVLTYEQNPPAGFIQKMSLLTGILWSSYEERPIQESICRMTGPEWTDQRLYERNGWLSNAAVRDSTNRGIGLANWEGHGNESGIYMSGGSTPVFVSSNVDALTNDNKGGVVTSIACDCGAWDLVPNGDCFADHWLNNTHGGSIGAIMNSRYGYGAIGPGGGYVPGPSERYDTTYIAAVINWGLYHEGEALSFSKASWAPYADSEYQYAQTRYCAYGLNLLGDPETPVWTDEPEAMVVNHPAVITIGSHIPLMVTVTTQGSVPIAGATVLAVKAGEVNAAGLTNGSGQVTLDVSPVTPGPMSLTVVAHNYFTHIDTVQVISTARYVAYLRSTIADPGPGGNGDSILNPGETVEIPTWLKNWGQESAAGVNARLRTHDANATVTDSVKTFGTVSAGDSVWTGADGFGLQVAAGLANGYSVSCSLICRDANDSTWVSLISFTVGAPVLAKEGFAVRDSVLGNGNGKLDPNETVELEVTIHNAGLGHGYHCRGVLRTNEPLLAIEDSLADYGYVAHGASVVNAGDRFRIAAGAIVLETPVTCTLELFADGGYHVKQAVTIIVGQITSVDPVPDGPRTPSVYYGYDECDAFYPQHPTWNWIEVRGRGTRLTLSDDQTVTISLPVGFGPIRFYGQRYTQLAISSNGFVVPGSFSSAPYTNAALPTSSIAGPAICALWTDLYPPTGGGVWWFYDTTNRALVVEYDSVSHYPSGSAYDKFEIIIFDTTTATPDGNSRILVQYLTANSVGSITAGIQNQNYTIAVPNLHDGTYHRGCAQLAPRRAILYAALTLNGIADDAVATTLPANVVLRANPNPCPGVSEIAWSVNAGGRVALKVYDPAGREVRTLVSAPLAPGRYTTRWDGRANSGGAVPAGIYFCKLETPSGTSGQKLVVSR